MIENIKEVLTNPKTMDIVVGGKDMKTLLSYVRHDKKTGEFITWEQAKERDPMSYYIGQVYQYLEEPEYSEFFEKMYGPSIDPKELAKEYLSLNAIYQMDDEEDISEEDE